MTNSSERKQSGSIACPYCGVVSAGSFSTVEKTDEAGPTEILYKCKNCGRIYIAERVTSWHVKKG